MPSGGAKRIAELAIDAELLSRAEQAGVDLSIAAEAGIRRDLSMVRTPEENALREARRQAWKSENADAIRSSNEYVEKNGLPLARYRLF